MGALHRGHATLIRHARHLAGPDGYVVVSIFVNRKQFGPTEDFATYPRPFTADRELCRSLGVDLVLHPTDEEMYPRNFSTMVVEHDLSLRLCGASRPGHFRGVTTVVAKLFHITAADVAVFGMKDLHQLTIVCRMVRDLNFPVRIVPVATERESDGLALSSRNQYLTPEERRQAPVIRGALLRSAAAFRAGETNAVKLRQIIRRTIASAPLARIDYVELVERETLRPLKVAAPGAICAVAVFFGHTRLIDSLALPRAK